ncbi:MAG: Crp/Fnr family transcriptional regulator [Burkholderiales bacterium]|nr:Crp/Fnr family transcriptional regulator [Burkholderiales bacterium]
MSAHALSTPAADARPSLLPRLLQGRWFASLGATQRQQLLAAARVLQLPAGAALFLRGEANCGLYCVLDGAVRVGAVSPAVDRNVMLALLEPPEWFGEIAFFDGGPRTHDAHARGPTTLLYLPRAALERLLADDPLWWQALGRLLAEKVRALFIGIEELTALPAPARVARRLLAMAQGHGMRQPNAAQRTLAINQEQLGAMLSLTRQTVSEVLGDFEARGWVKRRYGAIELLDAPALAAAGAAAGAGVGAGGASGPVVP